MLECSWSLRTTALRRPESLASHLTSRESPASHSRVTRHAELTIARHAECQAFLEAAVLTPVAVDSVDDAVLLAGTLVVDYAGLRAAEEALAALARDDAIVHAGRFVPAHFARNDLDLGCNTEWEKRCQFGGW